MKKRLVLLLALALLAALIWASSALAATSGSCGAGVTYELTQSGSYYALTIEGSGSISDYTSYSSVPWYSYAGQINKIVVGSGVTGIGKRGRRAHRVPDL